ncbi:MAG: hypothetical protein ACKKMV_00325 [Candidatus Nealsonbacteria bacterium]
MKEKNKLEIESIKTRGDLLFKIIFERYKILPLISTLSVALLVLSTINERLIKNFLFFKASLIMLILLIPASVFVFLTSLKKEEETIARRIEEIGKQIENPSPKLNKEKGFLESLLLWSPWIITELLTIGIFWFILSLFIL